MTTSTIPNPYIERIYSPDDISALQFLAEAGDADAQYSLGRCYDRALSGLTRDEEKARHWLEASAAQSNAKALDYLGCNFYECDSDSPEYNDSLRKRVELLKRASLQNYAPSMYGLYQLVAYDGFKDKQDLINVTVELSDSYLKRAALDHHYPPAMVEYAIKLIYLAAEMQGLHAIKIKEHLDNFPG